MVSCNFIALDRAIKFLLLYHSLIHFLQTAQSLTRTPPTIPPASFMIFIASTDTLGGFTFAAFSAQNIRVVVMVIVKPIQDGIFWGCSWMGGGGRGKKGPSLHKICHTYPAMMKLGTVIPQSKEIQKIYELRETPVEFC